MGTRPLRQFYDHDRQFRLDGLGPLVAPWQRHRRRFLAALGALTAEQWEATTRCDEWNARDVLNHLVTADGFWAMTLEGGRASEATRFLVGFDPSSSPGAIIAGVRDRSPAAVLEAFAESTERLGKSLESIADDEWSLVSESPFGHVPLGAIAAHALWDSWLHERDVLLPLGSPPPVETDELAVATAFTMFLGGAQGGLLHDPDAVGPGPEAAVGACVSFTDLPGVVVDVRVDGDVRVTVASGTDASPAGSALELVEGVAGRRAAELALARLPADLAAQLERARQIL